MKSVKLALDFFTRNKVAVMATPGWIEGKKEGLAFDEQGVDIFAAFLNSK